MDQVYKTSDKPTKFAWNIRKFRLSVGNYSGMAWERSDPVHTHFSFLKFPRHEALWRGLQRIGVRLPRPATCVPRDGKGWPGAALHPHPGRVAAPTSKEHKRGSRFFSFHFLCVSGSPRRDVQLHYKSAVGNVFLLEWAMQSTPERNDIHPSCCWARDAPVAVLAVL